MRSEEIRNGIDVFPTRKPSSDTTSPTEDPTVALGRSKRAALLAVSETALSRIINATPIMVLPPLILLRLQRTALLTKNPRLTLPVNLGLILGTSLIALPAALGVFPARERIDVGWVEEEFKEKVGAGGEVEFNRGL
jgi:hypothetical protein